MSLSQSKQIGVIIAVVMVLLLIIALMIIAVRHRSHRSVSHRSSRPVSWHDTTDSTTAPTRTTQSLTEHSTKTQMPQHSNACAALMSFMDDTQAMLFDVGIDLKTRSELIALFRSEFSTSPGNPKTPKTQKMEQCHNYIQLLFPTVTKSQYAHQDLHLLPSDVKYIATPDNKHKIFEHFNVFLQFMGVEFTNNAFTKVNAIQWNHCMDNNNHNASRISRIIESLTLFEHQDIAQRFTTFLQQESNRTTQDHGFAVMHPDMKASCNQHWCQQMHKTIQMMTPEETPLRDHSVDEIGSATAKERTRQPYGSSAAGTAGGRRTALDHYVEISDIPTLPSGNMRAVAVDGSGVAFTPVSPKTAFDYHK